MVLEESGSRESFLLYPGALSVSGPYAILKFTWKITYFASV